MNVAKLSEGNQFILKMEKEKNRLYRTIINAIDVNPCMTKYVLKTETNQGCLTAEETEELTITHQVVNNQKPPKLSLST